jgi:hypothetical protein
LRASYDVRGASSHGPGGDRGVLAERRCEFSQIGGPAAGAVREASCRFNAARDVVDAPVTLPLTPARIAALRRGTVVRVDLLPDAPPDFEEAGGYMAFVRQ